MYKGESGQSFSEKASSFNMINAMKGESTVNINDRSSNVLNSYIKNNLLFSKNEESSFVQKDYVVYGSGMNKEGYNRSESKKYPTKKISSDKKKRVVNIDKRKVCFRFINYSFPILVMKEDQFQKLEIFMI